MLHKLKLVTFLSVVTLLISGNAMAKTKWDFATSLDSANVLSQVDRDFIEDVVKNTNGSFEINYHPGATLFTQGQTKRAVQTGQVELGSLLLTSYSNEEPIYGLDSLPFLTSSYDDAWTLWEASRKAIEDKLGESGLMVLYSSPLPPQGLFSRYEIESVDDLDGLKWRAYSPLTAELGELLGARPVNITSPELSQALITGAVDAFMTSSATGYDTASYEQVKYLYDTRAWIPKNIIVVNKKSFEKLDEAQKTAILDAAKKAEKDAWEKSAEKNEWYLEKLAEKGMQVQPPSEKLAAQLDEVGKTLTEHWKESADDAALNSLSNYLGN